ncbi:MAG TPA: septation protein SepH [Streptosporangiaceae bacterium]
MQELRLVAVSEDGSYAVLVVPGRSGRFALPIDERLRTVARGQFSRLAQYEIEVESPLRPKEIQDRIRAGETAEEIADAAGLPVDRIRRFEGPVLAEREFRAKEAQQATVRGEAGPGPRLGDVVAERLSGLGASTEDVDWDSRKRQDGNWQVQLAYTLAGRMYLAEWVYDTRSRHVTPADDEAIRLCLDESQWPGPRPAARTAVTATVTPISARAAAAHQPPHPSERGPVHPSRQAPAMAPPAVRQAAGQSPVTAAGRVGMPSPSDPRAEASPAEPKPAETRTAEARTSEARTSEAQPAPQPAAESPAPAPQARPARRASGRSRRSSVPSWDEIMFGNSRQPE